MGQQQAQTNNNIIRNKTLVTVPPNEEKKKTYMPLQRGGPLPSTAGANNPKHNSEIPVETEFSNPLRPAAGKQTLLSYLPTPPEVFLSKQGRKGKSRGTWNYGITVNE
jgi:hypothetical protein